MKKKKTYMLYNVKCTVHIMNKMKIQGISTKKMIDKANRKKTHTHTQHGSSSSSNTEFKIE